MVTKTTPDGRAYEVNGRKFTWHPLDDDDQLGNVPDITIPLRLKVKLVQAMPDGDTFTPDAMFAVLEALIPGQADQWGELDLVTDFTPMFAAWQSEYNLLTGASLGESSGSPNSSASTDPRSTTTGEPASI